MNKLNVRIHLLTPLLCAVLAASAAAQEVKPLATNAAAPVLKRMSPKATAKMKEFAGTLQVEPAIREIIEQLLARKYLVIPGFRARLTRRLAGYFPGLLSAISDGIVRKALAE